jgi:hypothetical protein
MSNVVNTLDPANDPVFTLRMRDGEVWKFSPTNAAFYELEQIVKQPGRDNTMEMVFAMSLDYRNSNGLQSVTFSQFRDNLLPSVRKQPYKILRDQILGAMNGTDEGNESQSQPQPASDSTSTDTGASDSISA